MGLQNVYQRVNQETWGFHESSMHSPICDRQGDAHHQRLAWVHGCYDELWVYKPNDKSALLKVQ